MQIASVFGPGDNADSRDEALKTAARITAFLENPFKHKQFSKSTAKHHNPFVINGRHGARIFMDDKHTGLWCLWNQLQWQEFLMFGQLEEKIFKTTQKEDGGDLSFNAMRCSLCFFLLFLSFFFFLLFFCYHVACVFGVWQVYQNLTTM